MTAIRGRPSGPSVGIMVAAAMSSFAAGLGLALGRGSVEARRAFYDGALLLVPGAKHLGWSAGVMVAAAVVGGAAAAILVLLWRRSDIPVRPWFGFALALILAGVALAWGPA